MTQKINSVYQLGVLLLFVLMGFQADCRAEQRARIRAAQPVQAAQPVNQTARSTRTASPAASQKQTVVYEQSAPSESTDMEFAAGFSTLNPVPFGNTSLNHQSLTAILKINEWDKIQGVFAIPGTSPFLIGGMALYKRTLLKSQNAGLHVGGGLGIGNGNGQFGTGFAMSLTALAGFYFNIPSIPQIETHLDGGAQFTLRDDYPSSDKSFSFGALSPTLGLSVVYYF